MTRIAFAAAAAIVVVTPIVALASCTPDAAGEGEGSEGEGAAAGEGEGPIGGALHITLKDPAGDVACDPECTVDFGQLHRFAHDETVDLSFDTDGGTVRFDPLTRDGCTDANLVILVATAEIQHHADGHAIVFADGAAGACDADIHIFTNASNEPADGFVVHIKSTVFERYDVGDPCSQLDASSFQASCDGAQLKVCDTDPSDNVGDVVQARDCGAIGATCDEARRACAAADGGTCAQSFSVDDRSLAAVCGTNEECVVGPSLDGVCRASDAGNFCTLDGGFTDAVVDCAAFGGECFSTFTCTVSSGDPCVPGLVTCGPSEDECPSNGVCP